VEIDTQDMAVERYLAETVGEGFKAIVALDIFDGDALRLRVRNRLLSRCFGLFRSLRATFAFARTSHYCLPILISFPRETISSHRVFKRLRAMHADASSLTKLTPPASRD
jgi:hypothetical protein